MSEVFDAYVAVRGRMAGLWREARSDEVATVVPACPEWTAADLLAHVVSMPAALGAGRLPDGPIGPWLRAMVDERRTVAVPDQVDEWLSLDDALRDLLDGPGALLYADLAVHEHDLRSALGRPDHDALEVDVILPRTIASFAGPLREAGLPPLAVEHDGRTWTSHTGAEPGWVLLVDPWEATRAVNSRRTADELRSLPHRGDPEPYLPLLDAHLPLPARSLGEP